MPGQGPTDFLGQNSKHTLLHSPALAFLSQASPALQERMKSVNIADVPVDDGSYDAIAKLFMLAFDDDGDGVLNQQELDAAVIEIINSLTAFHDPSGMLMSVSQAEVELAAAEFREIVLVSAGINPLTITSVDDIRVDLQGIKAFLSYYDHHLKNGGEAEEEDDNEVEGVDDDSMIAGNNDNDKTISSGYRGSVNASSRSREGSRTTTTSSSSRGRSGHASAAMARASDDASYAGGAEENIRPANTAAAIGGSGSSRRR